MTAERHIWYTPADIAAWLEGTQHGSHWRARCPAHHGDNPQALLISQGKDSHGNPMTLLHCFAHDCSALDICAALGIHIRTLFAIHPDYAKATRNAPRAHSPRLERLKWAAQPHTADEIAQALLEEMIVSDPDFIRECAPARVKMWELAQGSPKGKTALTRALQQAHISPLQFWDILSKEQEG